MENKVLIARLEEIIRQNYEQLDYNEITYIEEAAQILRKVENGELVEVVRCKDCDYLVGGYKCEHWNDEGSYYTVVTPNQFCSCGEKALKGAE